MYTDRTLTCRDCGQSFIFTAGEQEFYAEKGFTSAPTRCRDCRRQRKNNMSPQKPRASAPREMHDAVCDKCGAQTQVPFAPRGDKPVYCSDCYREMNPRNGRR